MSLIRNVLVVDDEPLMREFVGESLQKLNCDVHFAHEGIAALRLIESNAYDMVFTDMKMPKLSGLDVLKKVKQVNPGCEVVIMTAYGTVENAVSAMKEGAADYLLKPFTVDQVEFLYHKCTEKLSLKAQNAYFQNEIRERLGFGEIVGKSKPIAGVYEIIQKVASSKATVLISGKSGTGKELIARALHYHNQERKNAPFIKLNCAALPANLIESELFGHEKGAFTGALTQRIGRFELAHGGTIFLDEISEIDINLQAKLLRVLQEREFERIGGGRTIQVDVRVIASTNRDLKEEVSRGTFREDLYYRLNVVPIYLPPLKDRKSDIPLLANYFLKRLTADNKKNSKIISPEGMQSLIDYDWPGNIRELENLIERAVVMDRGEMIDPSDFGFSGQMEKLHSEADALGSNNDDLSIQHLIGRSLQDIEKEVILNTLAVYGDNRTKCAEILGISIRTLRNKLNEYQYES